MLEREKIMIKRGIFGILKTVLACSLILTVLPIQTIVLADEKAVSTFTELKGAIENAKNGDIIQIKNDIEMENGITVPDGKTITIQSEGSNVYKLKYSNQCTYLFFSINKGGALTLKNIHIQGDATISYSFPLIENYGSLILDKGTTISDNHISVPAYRGAGGVHNMGTLTMKEGALIENCSHSEGGKAVANEGIFYMEGGHLKGNEKGGYGVLLNMKQEGSNPEFYMSGGIIDGPLGTFEGDNRGGAYSEGNDILIRIGGNVEINPVALDLTGINNYVQVDKKLEKQVVISPGKTGKNGQIIAKGYNYILTEEDKNKIEITRGTLRLDTKENALILGDLPIPTIKDVELDKEHLPYKNSRLNVTFTGENLPEGILANAFEKSTQTDIKGYSREINSKNVTIVEFPENTEKTVKEYTIKFSLDNGKTWIDIEKTVTVAAQPNLANANNNTFKITPQTITTETPIIVEAVGDRQDVEGVMEGDQRYIPSSCGPDWTSFQYINGTYIAEIPPLYQGTYDIKIYYELEEYRNGSWKNSYETDIKQQSIEVKVVPKITNVYVFDNKLPHTGGEISVDVQGIDLSDGMLVTAFDNEIATNIQGTTQGFFFEQSARLSFPENKDKIPKKYTIRVSTDNGATWDPKETIVTVSGLPYLANADNNAYTITPQLITTDTPITIQAIGDRQDEKGINEGDQRYIPSSCGPDSTPFQYINGTYIAEISPLDAGSHTIYVNYDLEEYSADTWNKIKTVNKEQDIDVKAVPKITNISVDKENLPHIGAEIQVNIEGKYLSNDLLVQAFDDTIATNIKGTTQGSTTIQSTKLTIPENTKQVLKSYTIKVSMDNGVTWNPIKTIVNVLGLPYLANADHNAFTITPQTITTDTPITIEAIGDRQSEKGINVGDERYIPIVCGAAQLPFEYKQNAYVAELPALPQGKQVIRVEYALEKYDGTTWSDTKTRDIKEISVDVIGVPKVTSVDVSKVTLPYTGDTVQVDIQGEYLEKGILVKVFANQQPITIQGYTGETGSTLLSFPANEARTPQVYTVKVSLDDGATWQSIEKEITVEGKPITANPENNSIEIPFGKITTNTKMIIKAIGDRQEEQGIVAGDERYIPKEWKLGKEVFQYEEGRYVTELTSLPEGLHKLEVTYALERFDGAKWILTSKRDTKSKTIQVEKEVFNDPMLILDTTKLTLFVGDTSKVEYRLLSNDMEISVNWKSMDAKIAEVDANGVVHAKRSGSTIIKLSTSDGKYIAECEVQVLEK